MSFLNALKSLFIAAPRTSPAAAAHRVRAGTALLIDVREPNEWENGVAEHAVLLPLTDLLGARKLWKPFLDHTAGRELLCYCAAGGRSGVAARLLAGEGFAAMNAGSLRDWKAAGWPVVPPGTRGAPPGA